MKYAVVKTGGKQYLVQPGSVLSIEKIPGEVGQEIELKEVLDELVSLILDVAYNLQPFLPETSKNILGQFSGKVVSQKPLFPRI